MQNTPENNFIGSGWAFPVTFSEGNFQLELSSYAANVNETIRVILQTKKGERSLEPNFGSGLQQFFFRKMDEGLKGEIADTVKMSLLHYEPRITVKEIQVQYEDIASGKLSVHIIYVLNQTNTRHNYVFPFYLKEGTNLEKW